ncbi:hypothetical protein BJ138DRAFT_267947 [Hygrophoropsis aurantiaca]|uniref:Uncharacterized protein n=1 Tax=Hygrophoropsis aurantiaca TaxID=72124 RepID=A0ACB8AQ86_9AGAM|nr:hypothetical protein BJ138DRAFT_267947 [Hygrophoropsis aurantiaca]
MIPRVSKRYASTAKPKTRQGRKGHLYGGPAEHPPVSPEEQVRITKRRVEKAERDERMDITMALTPVKTYMGGFTRPRDMRALYWSKGGRYHDLGKVYETPPASAYVPHTVYLLEGRYPTKHGVGRADTLEHIVGVCRECDFPDVLQKYNSERAPRDQLEAMDNARWPWQPTKRDRRVKWWEDGENPQVIVRESRGENSKLAGYELADKLVPGEDGESESYTQVPPQLYMMKQPSSSRQQVRGFHSSACAHHPTSYNEDHIVPDFYVKHKQDRNRATSNKSGSTPSTTSPSATDTQGTGVDSVEAAVHDPKRQTASVKKRKHEEAALMQHLSDSILSDEIAASTRRLRTKTPVEHYDANGMLVHASGYVVPGTGHASSSDVARSKEKKRNEERDRAAQTASVAEAVLESDLDHLTFASTRPRSHKVPFEIREPDGTVKHPSGFVPPTPANEFKYSDSASLERDLSAAVGRQRARETDGKNATRKDRRGLHTTAIARAMEVSLPVSALRTFPPHMALPESLAKEAEETATASLSASTPDAAATRERYLPTLSKTPFFRPLLTLTVSTRPLGTTLVRLSRALPRGLPFYASIDPEDRKVGTSFSSRMRNLRLDRMHCLSVSLAQALTGARGGLVGVRFNANERGRGVEGESLEKALDWNQRVIGVGVGNWYQRAAELKDAFKTDGEGKVASVYTSVNEVKDKGPFDVYGLDAWGRRISDETGEMLAYPPKFETSPMADILMEKEALKQDRLDEIAETNGDITPAEARKLRKERKLRKQEVATTHSVEMARMLAGNHHQVVSP